MTPEATGGRFFAKLFHFTDRIHDKARLPVAGFIWALEARLRGCKLGRNVRVLGRPLVKLHPFSEVSIGDRAILVSDQRRSTSGNLYGPCRLQTHSATSLIRIGRDVGLNGASIVSRSRSIIVGDGTMLAPNCVILDSPYHRLWPPEARQAYPEGDLDQDIVIGANCWIGNGCLILPGAEIGDNSVVGARSVVTGKIPANCLAVGSPAKVLRQLNRTPAKA